MTMLNKNRFWAMWIFGICAQARGQSYNIHPYAPMGINGHPRDRCEANLALAGANGDEDNRFPTAVLKKLKSMQAKPCRTCKL